MKKTLTVLAMVVVAAFSAKAQDTKTKTEKGGTQGTFISIGGEAAVPTGDVANTHKLGLGGSAKVGFNVINNGWITLNAGYISFASKSAGPAVGSLNIIPIKAGFRYNLGGFYVEPQIGWTKAKLKGSDNSESSFTWAPNVGIMIADVVDLSARYESFNTDGNKWSHVGFRLAYNFNLGGR